MGFQSKKFNFISSIRLHVFKPLTDEEEASLFNQWSSAMNGLKPLDEYNEFGLKFPLEHVKTVSYHAFSIPIFICQNYVNKDFVEAYNKEHITVTTFHTLYDGVPFSSFTATQVGQLAFLCVNANGTLQVRAMNLFSQLITRYYESMPDSFFEAAMPDKKHLN